MYMELFQGILLSMGLTTVSFVIAVVVGGLLVAGLYQNRAWCVQLSNIITETIYAVPVIIIFALVFYSGIRLPSLWQAILALAIVGSAETVYQTRWTTYKVDVPASLGNLTKIILIASPRIWSRLLNYSALFYILGVKDMFRTAKIIMANENSIFPFFIIVAVYVSIHVVVVKAEKILRRMVLK